MKKLLSTSEMTQEEFSDILTSSVVILGVITVAIALIILIIIVRGFNKTEEHTKKKVGTRVQTDAGTNSGDPSSLGKPKSKKKQGPDKGQQQRPGKVSYNHPWLLSTLKAHSGTVLDLDFSSNKKYLASCADDTNNNRSSNRRPKKNQKNSKTKFNSSSPFTFTNTDAIKSPKKMICLPMSYYYISSAQPPPLKAARNGSKRIPFKNLPEAALYQLLRNYLSTDEQRQSHGYPIEVLGQPGVACVLPRKGELSFEQQDPLSKICSRCGKDFKIKENGDYLTQDKCVYHWGKLRKENDAATATYSCCSGVPDSEGCTVGVLHVCDGKRSGLLNGFVKTLPAQYIPPDWNFGICSLDCEMCFTTEGLEVARVTLLHLNGGVLYDAFVKPQNPIIDYNTRFSGLTAKDLDGVGRTLCDVQQDLLNILNSDTILIGHALENDLVALRILHTTVVDTSMVFPHRYGLPLRRSLRALVSTYLHKEIQVAESGHDSHEDALYCMELVLWKLQKDFKRKL